MLDDAHRQTEETVELPHPFGVAASEVVVHRDQMRAFSGQRVEIKRKRRHQRLAFAGRHFGNSSAMKHDAAHELDVEMHHVPGHGLIAHGEFGLPFGQAPGRVLHHRKRFRQNLVQLRPSIFHLWNLGELRFPRVGLRAQLVIG